MVTNNLPEKSEENSSSLIGSYFVEYQGRGVEYDIFLGMKPSQVEMSKKLAK